jgi:hypothetical protein
MINNLTEYEIIGVIHVNKDQNSTANLKIIEFFYNVKNFFYLSKKGYNRIDKY